MYIYTHTYIYIHTYTYIHTYIRTYITQINRTHLIKNVNQQIHTSV